MKAIVWSKNHCPYCDQFLEAVPNARTVPQVFLDGKLIGGYTELNAYFNNQ